MLTYVETVDGSKADSLHRHVKQLYDEDIRKAFELVVQDMLKKFKIRRCVIAIDTTKELYWGKNGSLNVRGIKHERGADEAFEWLVVSMVKPVPMTLMALPYRQGADLATLTIDLLKYVKSLRIHVDVALFDRAFYIAHLIDFLEAERMKYLILVPENERMKFYAEQTETIRAFGHKMAYQKDKSTWKPSTKIVVIKDVQKGNNKFDMFFATSLAASKGLLRIYPQRWQIETNFRVMDEAKIKSKSNEHIIRYFYFMAQLLLHLAWNATKRIVGYVQFKRYLLGLIKLFSQEQGIT
ncbi:transposase [Candidatus Woesearchaeota archaeon]|nr:transposase [Candidatus Woesearchaeota archaeon]